MAVRPLNSGVNQWNNSMPFPKDLYSCHCLSEEIKKSSKDNLMIERKWELISPEIVKIGDRQLSVAGLQITQYVTFKIKDRETGDWDKDASDKAFGNLQDDLVKLGFDGDAIDDENPPLIAKGKTADFVVYAKADKKYKSPTPEQLAKGQKIGDPIKGPDGKDIVSYQLNFDGGVQGLSAKQISSGAF